jgi:tRNA/tmRNA/rRNA uracil-C5-methylase (TrmA/RlmC/RlmD family)
VLDPPRAGAGGRIVRQLAVRARGPLRLSCDGETLTAPPAFVIRKRTRPLVLLVPP